METKNVLRYKANRIIEVFSFLFEITLLKKCRASEFICFTKTGPYKFVPLVSPYNIYRGHGKVSEQHGISFYFVSF